MDTRESVAVITGASTGIGAALAERMASRGTKVVVAARRAERLEKTAQRIRDAGGDVLAVATDVTDLAQVERLADEAWKTYGRVDLAVLNAGAAAGDSLLDPDLDTWRAAIDLNVFGLLHGLKVFVPRMLAQGTPGAVYATGSGTGIHGTSYRIVPYATTKNAQLSIMESLHGQLRDAKASLRAGIILPPLTRTNLAGDDLSVWGPIEASMNGISLIEPEDFARVVVDGIEEERFWVETTEADDARHLGGRNAGAIAHSRKMIRAKADAMTDHTPPDPYLW